MESAVEERLTDQLLRSASVPTKPMVEVTPESVTRTLPRSTMPAEVISAESAWTSRLSRTGCWAPSSSPVTAATSCVLDVPCSAGTSVPSARVAPVSATLAAGSVQLEPVTLVESASATTSGLTSTALSTAGGAVSTLRQKSQNCAWVLVPVAGAGAAQAAVTPPTIATTRPRAMMREVRETRLVMRRTVPPVAHRVERRSVVGRESNSTCDPCRNIF